MTERLPNRAFTLIELLIVVAIIAILAAIAVPNFLEAQTRAKVARAKSDMRTTATGLESYYVDNNRYPQCNDRGTAYAYNNASTTTAAGAVPVLERLSTPIAYVTTGAFRDSFTLNFRKSAATAAAMVNSARIAVPATDVVAQLNSYIYQAVNSANRAQVAAATPLNAEGWFLASVGPDRTYYNLGGVLANHEDANETILLIYDPTNGTVSEGDIWRNGGTNNATTAYKAGKGLAAAIQTQK